MTVNEVAGGPHPDAGDQEKTPLTFKQWLRLPGGKWETHGWAVDPKVRRRRGAGDTQEAWADAFRRAGYGAYVHRLDEAWPAYRQYLTTQPQR